MTWVRVMSETSLLKNTIPASRAGWFCSASPSTREPWATATSPSSTGLHQPLHLLGQVLAVGVEGDDDLRPGVGEQPVAGPQRRAAAAVDHVAGDDRAVGAGDVLGAVARAVVDDQDRGRDPADLGRDPVEHRADVVGLVVGGDQDRDPVAEALRMPGDAELLPGEPLEHRRELAW